MKKSKNVFITLNYGKKRKIFAFFACLFIIFAFFIYFLHIFVSPVIIRSSEAQMKIISNRSIDYAVTEAMSSFVSYDDIIKISKDDNGKIYSMTANSVKVNNISRLITQIALAKFVELAFVPLQIHIGAFSGIDAFASLGPIVNIDVKAYPDISCTFSSAFDSAGINQTQHKIYLKISSIVRVVFPLKTVEVKSASDILVCEGVIVGEIPDTYLKSNTLTEMLNLVP